MRVTVARPGDLDAVCGIVDACRAALEARGLFQWDARYPSRAFFRDAIASANLFALIEEERISGVAVLDGNQPPEWASAAWRGRDAPFLVVHAFAIAPRIQSRGCGTLLLAACEDVARDRGCASIRIDVFSENAGALRFYERHGYTFRGEVRFAFKPAGHQTYFCYEKSLQAPGSVAVVPR